MSSKTSKKYITVTFKQDGFSTCLAARDVGLPGEEKEGDLSSVNVGDDVSAYWQGHGEWYLAKVRRFSAEMLEVSENDGEIKKWREEFVGRQGDQEEEEDSDEGEKEEEATQRPKRRTTKQTKKGKEQNQKPKKGKTKKDQKEASDILDRTKVLQTSYRQGRSRSPARRSRSRYRSVSRTYSRSPSRSRSRARSRSPGSRRSRHQHRSHSRSDSRATVEELKKTMGEMMAQMEQMKKDQDQAHQEELSDTVILSKK